MTKTTLDRVSLTLTANQARALASHLKETVKESFSGRSDLELAHLALIDAMCRAVERGEKTKKS